MATRVNTSNHTKSRSGCKTCKQKRLKCDEARPACANCRNRRLSCPGYQQIYRWPSKCQTNTQNFSARAQKRFRATPRVAEVQSRSPRFELTDEQRPGRHVQNDDHTSVLTVTGNTASTNVESDATAVEPCFESWSLLDQVGTLDSVVKVSQSRRSNQSNALPMFHLGLMMDMELYSRPLIGPSPPPPSPPSPPPDTNAVLTPGASQIPLFDEMASPVLSDWLVPDEPSPKEPFATRKRTVRGLLKQFYGKQTPVPVPVPVVQQDTKLVEYYFAHISGIYSCFDSHLNPFRSLVGQTWSLSASMYYVIQSMAAAHLANEMPSMKKTGIELHRQAARHLSLELSQCYSRYPEDDHALLVLLLIGLSSAWHRPDDLGLPFLRTARSLMNIHPAFNRPDGLPPSEPIQQVFEEGMIYWELMISFVADDAEVDVVHVDIAHQGDSSQPPATNDSTSRPAEDYTTNTDDADEIRPHPWTGISPESQMLLARTGRLLRRVRLAQKPPNLQPTVKAGHLTAAADLETSLLALKFPPDDAVTASVCDSPHIESGDHSTSADDFVAVARTTRDCGLLELYRTFPELLTRRAQRDGTSTSTVTMALHILQLLQSIPAISSIHFHQLLPLTIAGSALRFPESVSTSPFSTNDETLRIVRARAFVRDRLNQLSVRLPAAPVRVTLKLLDEVWRRLDGGEETEEVFWLDVMNQQGLWTVMG